MNSLQIILISVFLLATVVGYLIIRNIPSLLHTPLMSGINALSGITVIGALVAFAVALKNHPPLSSIIGAVAIVVASANVFGGLSVTDRILKMFSKDEKDVK